MKFNETQIVALAGSIEHWYDLCTAEYTFANVGSTKIGGDYCACCDAFPEYDCRGCPIAEYTNEDSCDGTPYETVWHAIMDAEWHSKNEYIKPGYIRSFNINAKAQKEYEFLIEVMMSREPWE